MKLGVITDGISRDLAHALEVMDEFGLDHAELQYVGDAPIGDQSPAEMAEIRNLLDRHDKTVSSISRYIFTRLTVANRPGDAAHVAEMEQLRRAIAAAHELGTRQVRIFTPKKEQILFGLNGAEVWNVTHGAWDAVAPLIAPAVDLARAEGIRLVLETGNGVMVNSCAMARRLIDEMDALDAVRVLWDPANNCWCHELAYPDGYDAISGGYLGHINIKDVIADTPRATLEVCEMGKGQLAPLFRPVAEALRADGYDGVISFESVYHPGNGSFEDGFRRSIGLFRAIFGDQPDGA